MGFLEIGTPLAWEESHKVIPYVKAHGIEQLLHIWKINKDRVFQILCWGDELEYTLVHVDEISGKSQIYTDATEIIEGLKVREHIQAKGSSTQLSSEWHPEFGNHMVEAIPSPPFLLNLNSLLIVEPSMRLRRAKIQSILPNNKFIISITTFPRFGLKDFICVERERYSHQNNEEFYKSEENIVYTPNQDVTSSIFVKDSVFNPHPRFPTLVQNVIKRREANIFIKIPIYKDKYTGQNTRLLETTTETILKNMISTNNTKPNIQSTDRLNSEHEAAYLVEGDWSKAEPLNKLDRFTVQDLALKTINPVKDHIYMDCQGFGFSMSCTQCTLACSNIDTARYLYDQLATLAPLFLALTASTPFHRGLLSDYDTRWSALEQSADCRTEAEETGDINKKHNTCRETFARFIPKPRYSSASLYISNHEYLKKYEKYLNDTCAPINETVYEYLKSCGMDHFLAQHYGHLWIRDPVIIFKERINLDDTKSLDHFENLQSTNWNNVRFKPPPQIGETPCPIGWRVEFRSPDIQLTDFDNAAAVSLITIIAQAILYYNLNFYIPMSKNDINMERSYKRDAIVKEKFFIRRNIFLHTIDDFDKDVVELTLYDILAGNGTDFSGLIPLCERYIADVQNGTFVQKELTGSIKHSYNDVSNIALESTKILSGSMATNTPFLNNCTEPEIISKHDLSKTQMSLTTEVTEAQYELSLASNISSNSKDSLLNSINEDRRGDIQTAPTNKDCEDSYGKQLRLCFAQYASLMLDRASGKSFTCARFLREFVLRHPLYRRDSIINETICYDLTVLSILIGNGLLTSIDLHGEWIARHLLFQTPLPANIQLPNFSKYALQMIQIVREEQFDDILLDIKKQKEQNLGGLKFIFIQKDTITLNEISSIYTMPIGVTARTSHYQRLCRSKLTLQKNQSAALMPLEQSAVNVCKACASNRDLVQLTLDIYKNVKPKHDRNIQAIPKIYNIISSEEFTQAWILRGIDCVGREADFENTSNAVSINDIFSDTDGVARLDTVETLGSSLKKIDNVTDRGSTTCLSFCDGDCAECLDDVDYTLHEASRSLSLGFNNEQELEYFQQVCQASG